ncbi:hypothetical protein ACH492_15175 [Streptomyces sp. NPDC019443]|uniref:hypothetical protein n=1 Tax=Streptomyces sp. NPDC019443 TaxID=3365061 RepID=UPI0037B6B0DE
MSEITGPAKVHEAYAFACMRCGHGWEQSYEIEHHIDGSGQEYVVYKADGRRVPSPLSSPTCPTCGKHVVRIMRAGQVSSVRDSWMNMLNPSTAKKPVSQTGAEAADRPGPAERADQPAQSAQSAQSERSAQPERSAEPEQSAQPEPAAGQPESAEAPHHWHLSDLLHPFRK